MKIGLQKSTIEYQIEYRKLKKHWKYMLLESYACETGIKGIRSNSPYVFMISNGMIFLKKGYAWDGASGPAIDTKTFMRGSLVHDGLYQLMREGVLGQSWRKRADEILRRICLEDGMSKIRAWWVYWGVRTFAGYAAKRTK